MWLTAFVLKVFAQAKGLLYIDESVLTSATNWITSHQNADGSFDAVGFVPPPGDAGWGAGQGRADRICGDCFDDCRRKGQLRQGYHVPGRAKLSQMTDPYGVAITAYALELGKSPQANAAHDKLMSLAKEDENGLHWGNPELPLPDTTSAVQGGAVPMAPAIRFQPQPNRSAEIETTAYATLALTSHS